MVFCPQKFSPRPEYREGNLWAGLVGAGFHAGAGPGGGNQRPPYQARASVFAVFRCPTPVYFTDCSSAW